MSANTIGKAMREFRGKPTKGITSRMLPKKMKKKNVASNARKPIPSGPIICMMIC